MSKIMTTFAAAIIFTVLLIFINSPAIACECPECGECERCEEGVCVKYGECLGDGDCGDCEHCSDCYCTVDCPLNCYNCINDECVEKTCSPECSSCQTCDCGACKDDDSKCDDGWVCEDGNCVPPPDDSNQPDFGPGGPGSDDSGSDDSDEGGPAEGGDPVFLKDGKNYYSHQDLFIRGKALDVSITRRYRSKSFGNSYYGYGWDINYNLKIHKYDGYDMVVIYDRQNHSLRFTLESGSSPPKYTAAGYYDYVIDNQDGTYTLYKKAGKKLSFNTGGILSKIEDRHGNNITFTYSGSKLTTITDDIGRDVNFTYYDANDLLSDVNDFTDRTLKYVYDPNYDLREVRGPTGLTTKFTYDDNHNLLTITDPNNQTWLTNTYFDANDRVEKQTYGSADFEFSYNPGSNEATVTDQRGYDTQTVYDNAGNTTSYTIEGTYETEFKYNSYRRVTRKIYPEGNCIDYTYDPNGNITVIYRKTGPSEPNDANDVDVIATIYEYDSMFNFVKKIRDPMGSETTYDYNDINGNLEKITYPTVGSQTLVVSFTYNDSNQVETVTSPDGIIIKCEYYDSGSDPNGWLKRVIFDANESDPGHLEIILNYKYDNLGRVIEVADPNGNITKAEYSDLDQLTKITTSLNCVTKFSYNNCKLLSSIEKEINDDPNDPNQITSYIYNIVDKLKTATNPLNCVTKFDYDNSDNLSDANDAEKNNKHFDYDERNLLWKVIDANGGETKYGYNANGFLADINDPNGDVTSYDYDGFDRLIRINYQDDTNEVFEYDKNSNITSRKNRKGEIIYYEYDALNRMTVKNRTGDPNIYYGYDIAGRVVSVNDDGDITTYSYDRIGRVEEVNDVESRVIKYEYYNTGQRKKLTYPDNSYITYEYDAMGRVTYIKDDSNDVLAQYVYDELSRRTLLTLGNDANAVYEYDLADRLKKLTNNIDSGNSIVFDYANYDKVGNRLSMKVDSDNAHVYTYDCLYQLTNVDYNDGNSIGYSYDSLGNRTDVNDGSSISYLRNRLNQYYSVDGNDYIYDENGNLTNINDGEYEYVYDCENRLIEAKKNSQAVAEYGYDFAGRRISKTVYGSPNVTTKYCYDGEHVIAEYTGGTLVKKFVYGPGIDEPICMIVVAGESETVYYYHFDGLGSVAALSDVNSAIVERYSYDIFGEPNRVSGVHNPYMFTGRRYDNETGLYYYRERYYKPGIGRFLQADPIGYAGGLNLYAYCGNDPVNWIDPLGLHIMNILPMMRVPSIKWALGNQGEKGKPIVTDEDLLEAMVSAYNTWLKGVSRWSRYAIAKHIMKILDTNRFFYNTGPSTRFIYNGKVYTAEQLNYIGVGMGFYHFYIVPGSLRHYIVDKWNKDNYGHPGTEGEHFFAEYGYDYYLKVRSIVEGEGGYYGPPGKLKPPGW